jgi:spermidine synthase
VLVIATTGLVYELTIAAVASYVLGDSVRQFSLVIGAYLSALGLGAYLSRFVTRRLSVAFVDVELGAALVGGFSAPMLFLAFGFTDAFRLSLYAVVVLTGTLVGLELPLLMRILEKRLEMRELVARALSFDYAGALLGSLGFTFVLVPRLGLTHASITCGLLNASVGLASTWLLPATDDRERSSLRAARVHGVLVVALLAVGLAVGSTAAAAAEQRSYPGEIALSERSEYQRIVLTQSAARLELFLDGNLQFSSSDEHRYHEALVHPAMAAAARHGRIFVGGGGDGLAVREILEWPGVEHVTLVDLDPAVTRLGRTYPPLVELNRRAFLDERVEVINDDAMAWLGRTATTFDVVFLDFPDPTNYSLGKLYSKEFYDLARRHLAPDGVLALQASSPSLGRRSFWCVITTLEAAGLFVRPYHAFVPSFGDWGFALAGHGPFPLPRGVGARENEFLTEALLPTLFDFPGDVGRVPVDVNRLNTPSLVAYYLEEWIH